MVDELAGKVAIVTGGASGIGRGIVERFVAEGARVVIADIEDDRGEALAAALGADALFRRADVADPEQVGALVGDSRREIRRPARHGQQRREFPAQLERLLDDDLADFHRVMGVNVLGVMAGTRDAARHMADHGGGSIINMTSIGGIQAGGGVMTYRASKAAVIQFTKSAAIELAHYEIRVNAIAPGSIPTPLLASRPRAIDPEELAEFEASIRETMRDDRPLKREGTTDGCRRGGAVLRHRPLALRHRNRAAGGRRHRRGQGRYGPRQQGMTRDGFERARATSTLRSRASRSELNQSLDLIGRTRLTGAMTTAAGPLAPSGPAPPTRRSWRPPSGCMPSTACSPCRTGRSARPPVRATTPRSATTSAPRPTWCAPSRERTAGPSRSCANSWWPSCSDSGGHGEMRDWVACLVRPLTDHLADLGNPTWYARFAAQAMTDPAYYNIVVKGALSSPSLVQVVDGINAACPTCRPRCVSNATSWPATC